MMLDATAQIAAFKRIQIVSKIVSETRRQLDLKLASKFFIFEQTSWGDENFVSNIIAHLLNPKGSHAQGSRFLKAYLQMLFDSCVESANRENVERMLRSTNLDKAAVRREDSSGEGRRRIDITVEIDGIKFGIENKIWARDQRNQVEDYLDYKLSDKGFLVYLSVEDPDEKLSDWSIMQERRKNECANGRLLLTRYDPDMSDWIDRCLTVVQSDKIRWYLEEIKLLIAKFYGKTTDMNTDSPIEKLLLHDDEAWETALMTIDSLNRVKEEMSNCYLQYIFLKLDAAVKEKQLSEWKVEFDFGDNSTRWWQPIKVIHAGCPAYVSTEFKTKKKNYIDFIYGVWGYFDENMKEQEKSDYFAALATIGEVVLNNAWGGDHATPICKSFIYNGDWGSHDFIVKLREFYGKKENSELADYADMMVKEMVAMVHVIDKFYNEKSACL